MAWKLPTPWSEDRPGLRYLLVGNAPNSARAVALAASAADIIVQHNMCEYAELLTGVRANYVFITNSGPHAEKIIDRLLTLRKTSVFGNTRLIFARNPRYYALKKLILQTKRHGAWHYYRTKGDWRAVSTIWPNRTISFLSTATLEHKLRRLGMPYWRMPSTGMIAYDWLSRRLEPPDRLLIEGFMFNNWRGHPKEIERSLIRPISGD